MKIKNNPYCLLCLSSKFVCTSVSVDLDEFSYRDNLILGKEHRLPFVSITDINAGGADVES